MANHDKDVELAEEKQALSLFFTSLLADTEEAVNKEHKVDIVSEKYIEYQTEHDIDSSVFLPVIPLEIPEQTNEQSESEIIEVAEPHKTAETSGAESSPPVVDGVFQIMMFKTAGLTLAVPLVELSGVISWPQNITEMPGHKASYLGIVQHLGKKIPIIDIAQIVFPQERLVFLANSEPEERLHRIVFINDFKWGLACDAVNDVITIESEQIKWRKSGTKRTWLAGTVIEHMCALLDTKELSKLLNSDHY